MRRRTALEQAAAIRKTLRFRRRRVKTLRTRAAHDRPSRVRADSAHRTERSAYSSGSAHLTHRTRAPHDDPPRWTGRVASHPRGVLFAAAEGMGTVRCSRGPTRWRNDQGGPPVAPVRASPPPNVSHESRSRPPQWLPVIRHRRLATGFCFAPIATHGTSFVTYYYRVKNTSKRIMSIIG